MEVEVWVVPSLFDCLETTEPQCFVASLIRFEYKYAFSVTIRPINYKPLLRKPQQLGTQRQPHLPA